MTTTARPALALEPRTERRDRVVHVVEYSHFPRRCAGDSRQVGYTQDRSPMGLGLDLSEPLRTGDLLRVTLRDIDGEAAIDGLARVVWCRDGEHARYRAGLCVLRDASKRPLLRSRSGAGEAKKTTRPFDSR
jgi:hypothetical protein